MSGLRTPELSLSPPSLSYLACLSLPRLPMADLYPPPHSRTRHDDYILYNNIMPHSASSNSGSDDSHNEPNSPPKSPPDHQPPKPDSKPQATFLTKLYAYVLLSLAQHPPHPSQPPRAPREPPHDSLGPCWRAHHRRAPRAARSPCPSKHLSSIKIRELLPATKCPSSFIHFLNSLPNPMFFFLDLWLHAQG